MNGGPAVIFFLLYTLCFVLYAFFSSAICDSQSAIRNAFPHKPVALQTIILYFYLYKLQEVPAMKPKRTGLQHSMLITGLLVLFVVSASASPSRDVLSAGDVLRLKSCSNAIISPDGKWIAYTVSVPRTASDKPGGAYSELWVMSVRDRKPLPFITGKVNVSSVQWKPDGSLISFTTRRGENAVTQVWGIALEGGEAFQLTRSETSVLSYRWRPDGRKIVFIASEPATQREKALEQKGYGFIFYEESLKHRNLYMQCAGGKSGCAPEQLTENITVWGFEFSPDGSKLAVDITEQNLIDHRYMFRRVYLLDPETKDLTKLTDNPGKLGNYAFSPDGGKLAYCAALETKDHAVSQVYVINTDGSGLKNLTPPDFIGHVEWVAWKDHRTILYKSGEKVWPTLRLVRTDGSRRELILHSRNSGLVFSNPSLTPDFRTFVMTASSPTHPSELVIWSPGKDPEKLTNLNPWLDERVLGKQKIFVYSARDGQELEGLLIYPADFEKGRTYPLVVTVHGGPESHYSNRWVSAYSTPGQVFSGRGYFVFYPNYRASTGYGVEFALAGYEDAAGVEFDDIADGIDALIDRGYADKDRVGLQGGSYGGYAAAWFSSYYTKKVKAVGMFVGISNLISKRGTTDIPWEELLVHSGCFLEEMWEESLKRSPVYWAHQSETAVLILGGTHDTRVHPSQSLEYYRRLKMNDHPAVRLVQYPGEGHGNSRQPGRIDVLYRLLDWFDWYVKEGKPLDGPMPPLDISDHYGLDLPNGK